MIDKNNSLPLGSRLTALSDTVIKNENVSHPHSVLLSEDKPDFKALNLMGIELSQFLDSSPVPTFVLDTRHLITHWNKACEYMLGYSAATMVATQRQWKPFYKTSRPVLADLILEEKSEHNILQLYANKFKSSVLIPGAYEATDFFPDLGQSGLWLHFTAMVHKVMLPIMCVQCSFEMFLLLQM